MVVFTEADRKKLETLKRKEHEAKMAEKKKQKENDKFCKELFGMTVDEVKRALQKSSGRAVSDAV